MRKKVGRILCFGAFSLLLAAGCGDGGESGEDAPGIPSGEWKGGSGAFAETFEVRRENGVGKLYAKGGKKPFTGKVERRQANGERWEENYRDGLKDGPGVKYAADGARTEATYSNGVLHGPMILYDRQGRERSRWNYVEGRLVRPGAEEANASSAN